MFGFQNSKTNGMKVLKIHCSWLKSILGLFLLFPNGLCFCLVKVDILLLHQIFELRVVLPLLFVKNIELRSHIRYHFSGLVLLDEV